VPEFQVLAMDASGAVGCPLGGPRTAYDCLGCSYLRATARHPVPAIICEAREPA
jgi:hypothetical protein